MALMMFFNKSVVWDDGSAAFYSELKSLYLIIRITEAADTHLVIRAKRLCVNLFLTTRTKTLRLET